MKRDLSKMVLGVDFDGTCTTHEYPYIGRDIGAVPVLKQITNAGGKLILWTMRSGNQLKDAVQWFTDNDIPLYGVQRNPTQDSWTDSPKAYCNLYVDDANLGAPLKNGNPGERPYIDWEAVKILLELE